MNAGDTYGHHIGRPWRPNVIQVQHTESRKAAIYQFTNLATLRLEWKKNYVMGVFAATQTPPHRVVFVVHQFKSTARQKQCH